MGYQDDLMKSLSEMDIALIPSLFGAGMQQKIFEPIVLGIPTITSERGVAGYPLLHKKHIILCEDPEDFCDSLLLLKDTELRRLLSDSSKEVSKLLFSAEVQDETVRAIIG
jgi:hypothetical protein